ncbi:MAG TPA: PAS domain S-box protein [Verrucomicrobiae bacterium]
MGVIFAVGAVIVGILAYSNALQPVANAFVSKYQDHYDDVFSICGVVLAGFLVFSYRRWQEARKRMGRQANIEEALRILQTELEKRIRQRTAELAQANEALRSEITERQRVGEAQARLAAIVDSSEDAIIGKTLEGTIVSWNHGAEKVFGYSSAEAIGKPLLMLFPPERLKEEPEILARITRGEMVQHFETVRVRKDGRRIDVSATISPIFDDKGKIIGASKIARDITEHKEAEVKLRESEEIFATAFRSSPAGIALLTLDGRYLEVNAVYSSMLGYTREEMIGQTSISLNLTTAAERERVMLEFEHQDSSKKAHEMKLRRRDGSFADVLFTNAVMPLHGVPHRLGTIIDITARRRAEIRVQHLNRVYAVLSDINQTIVREKDSQALLEATCRIAVEKGEFRMAWVGVLDDAAQKVKPVASAGVVDGYLEVQSWDLQDESRKRGPTAWALLTGERRVCNDIEHDPDVLPWREAALQRGYRSSVAFPLKADGRVVGVFSLCSAEPDFFDEEELVLLDELAADIGFAMEVHEHEKERLAAEQESRWRTTLSEAVLNSTQDGILVVDTQGKKLVQNQRMKDIWKIPAEIFNEPDDVEQLCFVRSQIKNWQQFSDKVKHLYARPEEISIDEIELVDGRTLDRYSSPVRDREGKYYGRVWAFRDITEQRKLAEQLRQAQKMEAIGQLAGGVSHDFNNILAVIQMQADQLKFGKNLLPEHKELADEIAAAAQRAAALTRQLLLFSRKETLRQQDLDLNNSINNMAKMLRRTIGENVQMQFRFAMETLLVHADAGMIDQVLMNLAVNSRDAMPKGGKLVIETSVVEFNEQAVSQSAQTRPGSFICLAVSDTGYGIPPENLSRIFEPFFTTKGVGKGTGLGLATVFGIVQQHQGWINVYSEVGRGTTFRIYLPRLAKKSTQKSEADSTVSLPGGHETILLVEDDPFLRASIRKTLLQLGYRVLEAVNGIEALEIWTQHKHEIHLLLTDLVMPGGITGIDLGEQLLKDHPGLKVIYASGYAAEVAGKDFPLEEGVNFVTKPFSSARLAQTIRNRLDS